MMQAISLAVGAFFASLALSLIFSLQPNFPSKPLILLILVAPVIEEMCKFYFLQKSEQLNKSFIFIVTFGFIFFFLEFLLKFFNLSKIFSPSLGEFFFLVVPVFGLIMVIHVACALFYLYNQPTVAFMKATLFHAFSNLIAAEGHGSLELDDFRYILSLAVVLTWSLLLFWPLRDKARVQTKPRLAYQDS